MKSEKNRRKIEKARRPAFGRPPREFLFSIFCISAGLSLVVQRRVYHSFTAYNSARQISLNNCSDSSSYSAAKPISIDSPAGSSFQEPMAPKTSAAALFGKTYFPLIAFRTKFPFGGQNRLFSLLVDAGNAEFPAVGKARKYAAGGTESLQAHVCNLSLFAELEPFLHALCRRQGKGAARQTAKCDLALVARGREGYFTILFERLSRRSDNAAQQMRFSVHGILLFCAPYGCAFYVRVGRRAVVIRSPNFGCGLRVNVFTKVYIRAQGYRRKRSGSLRFRPFFAQSLPNSRHDQKDELCGEQKGGKQKEGSNRRCGAQHDKHFNCRKNGEEIERQPQNIISCGNASALYDGRDDADQRN